MKIPSFLYGRYPKVKSKCRRKVKDLRNGTPFDELPDGEWVDTSEMSGMIALDGPVRQFVDEEHFCCFALTRAIIDDSESPSEMDAMIKVSFEAAEREPWALLTVLNQLATVFLNERPQWLERYAHAVVRLWPILTAEGARFTQGLSSPQELWRLPTNIQFTLARLGVPKEKLRASLPSGGLRELASEVLADLRPVRRVK